MAGETQDITQYRWGVAHIFSSIIIPLFILPTLVEQKQFRLAPAEDMLQQIDMSHPHMLAMMKSAVVLLLT